MEPIMFIAIVLILIFVAIYRININKPILNFKYNNQSYLIFKKQGHFYLGKYKNKNFEIISEEERDPLKNIINILLSDNTFEDEINNLEILDNQNIPNINKVTNTIKLEMNDSKKKTFKNNCVILKDSYKQLNDNKQINFNYYMTCYIISTIIIPIIIFLIGYIFIENTVSTDGIFGGLAAAGPLLLLILGCNIFAIIYEIVYIIKIIKTFIKQYSKPKTIISLLLIQILIFLILNYLNTLVLGLILTNSNYILNIISWLFIFKIPISLFISSLIIIYDLRKKDKTDNPLKTSLRIKIIISLLSILAISLIIYRIVGINRYHIQKQQKTNETINNSYCTNYITETDKYIYCKTNTGNIKQINLMTKESKIYGNDINSISLYVPNEANSGNYIYYLDYNKKMQDEFYTINIANGEQTKIATYNADFIDIYRSLDGTIYYTVTDYSSPNPKTSYIYDPIKNNNTKLNEVIEMIRYIKGNKIYHVKEDKKLYIYDTSDKTDQLAYDDIYEISGFDKYIADKTKGIKYLIREGKLYIKNIVDNTTYLIDDTHQYQSMIIDNNKLYISYYEYSPTFNGHSIAYIDLSNTNYQIIETNIKFNSDAGYTIYNDYIYYIDNTNNGNTNSQKKLYKINLLDGTSKPLYNFNTYNVEKGNNNYIYLYTTPYNEFIRLDTNTDQYEVIDRGI